MERRLSFGKIFLDWAVIIVETTYSLTIIRSFTFDSVFNNLNIGLVLFMMLAYLIRFGVSFKPIKEKKCRFLYLFLLVIYLVDVIQNLIHSDFASAGYAFFFMINTVLFYRYLYEIYIGSKSESILDNQIVKPYISICLLNIALVIIAAILIVLGIIDATSNPMPINTLIEDNVNKGVEYYYPGGLSIALSYSRIFSDAGVPVLTGLSHEPHVLLFLVIPSFFLLFGRVTSLLWKIVLIASYASVLFISTSTTAVICLVLVLLIDIIWNSVITHNKKFIFIVGIIILVVAIWGSGQLVEMMQAEMYRKIFEETGSLDYTANLLTYVVTPRGILGQGNFPKGFGMDIDGFQIGIVTFFLDIVFYCILLVNSIILILKKDIHFHYVGLASLYLLLHGLKLSVQLFSYPLFTFVIFLIGISFNYYRSKIISSK